MTDQTQTTTEPVERESAHDAARRLFAVQYPGRSFEDIRELSKISWFVAAYNELADRNTTPQPLAIGLDRDAVARVISQAVADADDVSNRIHKGGYRANLSDVECLRNHVRRLAAITRADGGEA